MLGNAWIIRIDLIVNVADVHTADFEGGMRRKSKVR